MAISVKDIQEKEFGTQASGGYNIEQVDDFLDEISEQMATLVRENLELNKQIKTLEGDVKAARQAAEAAEATEEVETA
jgi:DivIVA domain-containing protein